MGACRKRLPRAHHGALIGPIEAGDDGSGEVTRTEAEPGLKMGTEELAALALGTVSASALARIGRVQEVVPGSLATADALFRSDVEPYCCTMF